MIARDGERAGPAMLLDHGVADDTATDAERRPRSVELLRELLGRHVIGHRRASRRDREPGDSEARDHQHAHELRAPRGEQLPDHEPLPAWSSSSRNWDSVSRPTNLASFS